MRDSGIDWIGEIPEHWEVKKLKHAGKIINGYAFPSDSFTDSGVRVMKISNIQTMTLDWTDSSFVAPVWLKKCSQFEVLEGDLVFALTRPVISTGIKASIVDMKDKMLLNQRNAVFRMNRSRNLCSKQWIYYIILSKRFVNEFEMQIDRTGQQPNISTISIGNLSLPVPPIDEQDAITDLISRESAKIVSEDTPLHRLPSD